MFFLHRVAVILCVVVLASCTKSSIIKPGQTGYQRPNFLFITSDDQSWQHTSFAGYPFIKTPNFDKIAKQGVYFENAYAPAPSCTASRASILTGQYPWRLGSAADLGGLWPSELPTFQNILKQHGYAVGFTGKGWGPGKIANKNVQPDGQPYFFEVTKHPWYEPAPPHANATSFALFLHQRPKDQPFSFWVGAEEPHRPYKTKGDISRFGNAPADKFIPGFLPDDPAVREDLAAYLTEIEHFDKILGQVIQQLKDYKVYDNTIIVVTSDNGMPFSRAKTQNYQYGVRVPLAIFWPKVSAGNNHVNDMVGLYDIAPTFLEAAEIAIPDNMNGKSLLNIIFSNQSGTVEADRKFVYTMTERHSYDARPNHEGYSTRAIYTNEYSLIQNNFPDRWPAGNDWIEAEAQLLVNPVNQSPIEPFFSLATAKRPAQEFYYLPRDPYQLSNQIDNPEYQVIKNQLNEELHKTLQNTSDPVYLTGKDVFSAFPWENSGPR